MHLLCVAILKPIPSLLPLCIVPVETSIHSSAHLQHAYMRTGIRMRVLVHWAGQCRALHQFLCCLDETDVMYVLRSGMPEQGQLWL